MASYKLAPLADEDLAKIVATTIETWGYAQAKAYAQAIDHCQGVSQEVLLS